MRKRDGTNFYPAASAQIGCKIAEGGSTHYKDLVPSSVPIHSSPRKGAAAEGGLPAKDHSDGGSGGDKLHGILLVKGSAGDSDADLSPLSTGRNRGTVTFANPKISSTEKELINIRDTLKTFKEQRKKLRRLGKQQEQLSSWLRQQQTPSDTDTTQVTEEVASMQEEIESLRAMVASQKVSCQKLVARAKVLTEHLGAGL